ncbi:MAG: hypothetical protein AB7K04_11695 [Pseudorhodoplanes sp.]
MPHKLITALFALIAASTATLAHAADVEYPQLIKMRYEAIDPKIGGNFTIWLERETIRQGLDQRLYPAARYVEVTHITPSVGSALLTMIEVQNLNSPFPEYYHIGGTVRFKVNGMVLKSSNARP